MGSRSESSSQVTVATSGSSLFLPKRAPTPGSRDDGYCEAERFGFEPGPEFKFIWVLCPPNHGSGSGMMIWG
ncbi:unnamed protein product [Prunus armeniaca]|uniref:Uncharacterized protein n=1 Tax=Prunus armeniaca TaxID=36596 RepID=A0A6J5UCV5_PRUAR|nr:unnamed protein product [Prunus armeniaca]